MLRVSKSGNDGQFHLARSRTGNCFGLVVIPLVLDWKPVVAEFDDECPEWDWYSVHCSSHSVPVDVVDVFIIPLPSLLEISRRPGVYAEILRCVGRLAVTAISRLCTPGPCRLEDEDCRYPKVMD